MTLIQPELGVDRGSVAVAFYQSAFNARVLHRVGEGDDIVAQLAVGDAAFWIAATGSSTERLVPSASQRGEREMTARHRRRDRSSAACG